ncbi:hypothetical protein F2P81_012918, partial [Scophthalmus maximus]
FERQQALVQEQLVRLAQREREAAAITGQDELLPTLIIEKGKTREEQEKAKILAKQLERKEKELTTISSFYKEQLEILEKKNFDIYKESAEQYNQSATKAEAHIRPRQAVSVCTELQAKVLECYRGNPQQTLQCSSLAKQYMTCVLQAKKVHKGYILFVFVWDDQIGFVCEKSTLKGHCQNHMEESCRSAAVSRGTPDCVDNKAVEFASGSVLAPILSYGSHLAPLWMMFLSTACNTENRTAHQ